MPDLNTLVLFASVAEARSFSGAARKLRVPLSTVSRRIAELEEQLGVRLLERSTRSLRLTAIGMDLLEHARRSVELNEDVASLVASQMASVAGTLRISTVPNIADSLVVPIALQFQTEHPGVRVLVNVTERVVDHIAEDIDLVFRIGMHKDSTLVTQKLMTYRHRLLASPGYLEAHSPPERPSDLLRHRLLAFSHMKPQWTWNFVRRNDAEPTPFTFKPHLAMNDFAGLAAALLAGAGIGDLPPIVRPDLVRKGQLVEVMPRWKFRPFDLSLIQVSKRQVSRTIRLFKELALDMVPKLFPDLPR